jgi:hypothetical protein
MGWYYCSWYRELTDLHHWNITVPHAVDQLVAWKTDVCWCIVPAKKGNISEAIANINHRTLHRVAQNMVKRVNACIQENGRHFQHLLWTVFQVLLYSSITKWNFGCVLKWTFYRVVVTQSRAACWDLRQGCTTRMWTRATPPPSLIYSTTHSPLCCLCVVK